MEKIIFNVPSDIEEYFSSKVWGKAYEIVRNNQIKSVRAINKNEIVAQVQGTALYTVMIKKRHQDVIIECNCPYWDNCKHAAAVCLFLRNNPEVELTNEKISTNLSEIDEFRLFLSNVQYELDSEEYCHDNEAYDSAINDCVDYIENCLAQRSDKIEMIFLLMNHFCLNRAASVCFINLCKEDNVLFENVVLKKLKHDDSLFFELCNIGDFLNNSIEKDVYYNFIANLLTRLSVTQVSNLKKYMIRHKDTWKTVKNLFE